MTLLHRKDLETPGPWNGRGGGAGRCLLWRLWQQCPRSGLGPGHRELGGKAKAKEWLPITKLGHQVKDLKIMLLEETFLFSLPIKDAEIIDFSRGHP